MEHSFFSTVDKSAHNTLKKTQAFSKKKIIISSLKDDFNVIFVVVKAHSPKIKT